MSKLLNAKQNHSNLHLTIQAKPHGLYFIHRLESKKQNSTPNILQNKHFLEKTSLCIFLTHYLPFLLVTRKQKPQFKLNYTNIH